MVFSFHRNAKGGFNSLGVLPSVKDITYSFVLPIVVLAVYYLMLFSCCLSV